MEDIESEDQEVGFENYEMEKYLKEREQIEQEIKKEGWHRFSRPQPSPLKFNDDFKFMQIDCDYTIYENECVVRMFGLNEEGNSVMVYVRGFLPYFYIEIPMLNDSNYQKNIYENKCEDKWKEQFINAFNNLVSGLKSLKDIKNPVVKVEIVDRQGIRVYKGQSKLTKFVKVYCKTPACVGSIRNYLKEIRTIKELDINTITYESNMPYALRFMIDKDIVGMGWLKLKQNQYKELPNTLAGSCQIKLIVFADHLEAIPTSLQPQIVPLRILSFDIECAAEKGFPDAKKDPVIQIACVVKDHNKQDNTISVVFAHLECDDIPGTYVFWYKTEKEILQQFQLFLQALDPDIITGYNIQNFDIPYLIDRAKTLKINNFGFFSRDASMSKIKEGKFLSKAMGMRDTKEINIEGRIQIDMMMHMMREHKLSTFSLNSVSFQFLNQQKEDVHHTLIYNLQYGSHKDGKSQSTPQTRKRIAVYCLKDSQLPLNLMDKLMCVYNYAEMARVTGVPINYLFMRGQQIKVASMLYRKAKQLSYIIPTENFNKSTGDKYEGATVLDPIQNFYESPIATLDFASLYPSIMIAHNLCYSTLLNSELEAQRLGLTKNDYIISPVIKAIFVKKEVQKGLLPQILEELIQARKQARTEIAKTSDPQLKAVLDGRQLAMKISANSVYGFTGAQIGQLPCLQISASVTAFGREMIEKTKQKVQENYKDAVVIYGDTDSVMVKFFDSKAETKKDKWQDRVEASRLGKEAAELISKEFEKPIKLEFEKVYHPYLLLNRKRYAGLYWTKFGELDKYDKIDSKGIETVRRDNCPLVRNMLKHILDLILIENNKNEAVNYTKRIISDLYQNKVDISDLVISKSLNYKKNDKDKDDKEEKRGNKEKKELTKTYKQKQAHTILAEKMQQRDETTAPAAGDRIPYIMIQGLKQSKNYDNAEDPLEVLKKDLPIDFDYYVNNQIKKPVLRIFEHVIQNAEALFKGEHTQVRYVPKLSNNSFMGKYLTKLENCFNCKVSVQNSEPLCFNCKRWAIEIITQKQLTIQQLELQYHNYWVQCQRCAGKTQQDVICQNRDCQIFYKRSKASKELQEKQDEMLRFQNW